MVEALTPAELKALQQFVSTDTTRPHLAVLWKYESEGGCTYVATDGHTIALRRSGKHMLLALHDIARMQPVNETEAIPPRWDSVLHAPTCEGEYPERRGINPAYFARVAAVEKAAGARRLMEYKPAPRDNKRIQALRKADLRNACSVWTIGSQELDGWYWRLDAGSVLWEGVIMPRRV